MRQAAKHDLHTTEGLAQVQHLRFVLSSGEVDTQFNGMTIRGGVLDDGIRDMPGSEIIDGRCALQLPRLAAGCHRYDVLVSGDGTDNPLLAGVIHVAPRLTPVDVDNNAPADYLDIVIPEDEGGTITVISESPAWVDDAVEKSLQERGMYVTPVSGTASMSPPGYDQDQTVEWSWARFRFGDDMLGGYRGSVCKVRDVGMWAVLGTTDTTPRWLDIWRRAPGEDWVLAARSSQAVAARTDVDLYMWGMIGDTEMVIGDEVALHVYGGTPEAPVELPLSIARQMVTAADGRGIASALDGPITDTTVMPAVMLSCTYQDGVSVGGVNLATRAEVQRLTDYTGNVGKQVYQDARASEAARDTAQEIAEGLSITVGTVTTGAPGSQATATLTPGSTPGAWRMDMTIPRGDVGTVDTAQAYTWTQPQTYDAMINANGGINIPLAAGAQTDTAAVSRAYALGMAHAAMMHQTRTYWVTSSCTATNGVAINHIAPGCYCEAILAANIRTSVTLPSAGALGGGNYSKIAGYSLPVKFSGGSEGSAFKISMIIGGSGQFEEYPDAGIDDFRLRPVVGSAADITRLVDVTLYYDNGYKARVRELIGIGSPKRYVVRTTLSNLDYNSNTNPCSATYRVVIAQSEIGHGDALAAGVWMVMGGLSNDTIIKLADIRCWDTYHVLYAPVIYLDAQAGLYGGVISAESPTIINGVGGNTYVRFGLEPYQRSWITSATEEPYTEQPTEL